jgi:hypothetical protein
MSALNDSQFAVFEHLTARPFLVLDTEYCADPTGDAEHLISVAVTRVVRGKRVRDGELYVEMNPGVPIDPETPAVLAALAEPDAVLICHTGADVRVLRRELERLDEAAVEQGLPSAPVGLADLPDLPIVDTSTLPRLLRLPATGNRNVVSLETLCAAVGVANPSAHHARADARATADALIALLRYAAATVAFDNIATLLVDHDRGTTHQPRLPLYIRSHPGAPTPPVAHLARHTAPLTHSALGAERHAWLDLAAECIALRCPHLRTEASLAAAENGAALLEPLLALLPSSTEPGQAGTLLGAVAALIDAGAAGADPPPARPTLETGRAMKWWAALRPLIAETTACSWGERCPHCWEGAGCPRDTLYQVVTRVATLAGAADLSRDLVKNRLFGKEPARRINSWLRYHPQETAYMTWMVAAWSTDRDHEDARYLDAAVAKDIHTTEPRLALLVCQRIAETQGYAAAKPVADLALNHATTDPAYDELRLWTTWSEHSTELAARKQTIRPITHPRLARPEGRFNHNPYLPRT